MIRFLFPALLLVMVLSGCKQADKLTQFSLEYASSVTITPASVLGLNVPFDLFTPDITSNAEAEFAVNDTRKDLIESILLENLTLTLTSPETYTFDFLKAVDIYISDQAGNSTTRIAYAHDIPDTAGRTLVLTTTGENIADYIKADAFKLKIQVTTDKTIGKNVEIAVDSRFLVDAKILGQ